MSEDVGFATQEVQSLAGLKQDFECKFQLDSGEAPEGHGEASLPTTVVPFQEVLGQESSEIPLISKFKSEEVPDKFSSLNLKKSRKDLEENKVRQVKPNSKILGNRMASNFSTAGVKTFKEPSLKGKLKNNVVLGGEISAKDKRPSKVPDDKQDMRPFESAKFREVTKGVSMQKQIVKSLKHREIEGKLEKPAKSKLSLSSVPFKRYGLSKLELLLIFEWFRNEKFISI